MFSLCDNTNPNAEMQEPLLGYPTAGIYGYTHAFGGYAGAHAQYVRVPHADVDCFLVPEGVTDEQVVFLSDAVPTGYMGAGRVIGIDRLPDRLPERLPERLQMAQRHAKAEVIDYSKGDVVEILKNMTGGRGPDSCIDAVGMEAHGTGIENTYDKVKQVLHLHTDRGEAIRQAILACRKGGTLSMLGVYGMMDKFPLGVIMNKGMTLRTAQQHGQKYLPKLLDHLSRGELDPSYLVTHRFSLEESPRGYEMFKNKEDGCVRSVFIP